MNLHPNTRPVAAEIQPGARVQSTETFEYGCFRRFNSAGHAEVAFDGDCGYTDTVDVTSIVEVAR